MSVRQLRRTGGAADLVLRRCTPVLILHGDAVTAHAFNRGSHGSHGISDDITARFVVDDVMAGQGLAERGVISVLLSVVPEEVDELGGRVFRLRLRGLHSEVREDLIGEPFGFFDAEPDEDDAVVHQVTVEGRRGVAVADRVGDIGQVIGN